MKIIIFAFLCYFQAISAVYLSKDKNYYENLLNEENYNENDHVNLASPPTRTYEPPPTQGTEDDVWRAARESILNNQVNRPHIPNDDDYRFTAEQKKILMNVRDPKEASRLQIPNNLLTAEQKKILMNVRDPKEASRLQIPNNLFTAEEKKILMNVRGPNEVDP
jgi:hypothetical protein